MVNIIHICTKNGKYCTNFVNVYKICQFVCVYNIICKDQTLDGPKLGLDSAQ